MIIVRVYGIVENPNNEILLSSEVYNGKHFTKFIGGGLEHGEGTIDCLKREIVEETGLQGEVNEHVYTTDFYLKSAFNPEDQIISIYYRAHIPEWKQLPNEPLILGKSYDAQTFHWIKKDQLQKEMLSFPADKYLLPFIVWFFGL